MIAPMLAGMLALTGCGLFYCATCFPAGTKILTPQGAVAIEALKVGDQVVSYDLETGAQTTEAVVETYVHETDPALLTLTLESGAKVRATAEHPFFVVEHEVFRRADAVVVGEHVMVRGEDGKVAGAAVTAIETHENAEPVYNVKVSGSGAYFAEGILAKYY